MRLRAELYMGMGYKGMGMGIRMEMSCGGKQHSFKFHAYCHKIAQLPATWWLQPAHTHICMYIACTSVYIKYITDKRRRLRPDRGQGQPTKKQAQGNTKIKHQGTSYNALCV